MTPLRGIRVLDLTRLLPGPICSNLLTRLGANVVKVEGLGAGQSDYVRDISPLYNFKDNRQHGALFEALHAGKQGLALDLKNQDGPQVLKRLVKNFDVIIEGNRPGVMQRLGVGYEDLKKENEKLIFCSISGYGQTGPYSQRAGHDSNYLAVSGLLGLSGKEGEIPPTIGFQSADAASSMQAVIGILAAILERQHNGGVGQMVDISITEAVMTLAVPSLSQALAGDVRPRGQDMLNGGLVNYKNYKTKDGKFLSVGALEPHFWKKLCDSIGRPELTRCQKASEIDALFLEKDLDEWLTLLHPADVCVEPIMMNPQDIASHPQHVARQVILDAPVSEVDPSNSEVPPPQLVLGPRLSHHFPFRRLPPAPKIGEHSRSILSEAGFSTSEIDDLTKKGVVHCLDVLAESDKKSSTDEATAVPVDKIGNNKPFRVSVIAGQEYYWCSCGLSKKQPFCDGSHKTTDCVPQLFVPEEDGLFPFCGCKISKKGMRCDGSHKKLRD